MMALRFPVCAVVLVAGCLALAAAAPESPVQVHLGLGMAPDSMAVNWATFEADHSAKSTVQYGETAALGMQAAGNVTLFTQDAGRVWSVHTATMTGLKPDTPYFYRVGDEPHWSKLFKFRSSVDGSVTRPQAFLVYGDMGASHAYSLCWDCDSSLNCSCSNTTAGVISEVNATDMVLHVGDFAYNLDTKAGAVGDQFMANIEPVAAAVPYMVSLGNHESAQNFAHYTERFRHMPSNSGIVTTDNGVAPNNWYYSWNVGLVHFVAISTEIYFDYFAKLARAQHEWLENDLKSVNRTETPWVVVHGHRSIYCSCDGDCDVAATVVREGPFGLEPLLHKYGVEFFLNGHEHDYERSYPVYRHKAEQTTDNPKATTYIVTGSAGCQELHEPFTRAQPVWSAFRSNTYGYSRMVVHNRSHVHWQQVQTQKDTAADQANYGRVIDDAWYVFDHHGSFDSHAAFWEQRAVGEGDPAKSLTHDHRLGVTFSAAHTPRRHYAALAGHVSAVDCVTGRCH